MQLIQKKLKISNDLKSLLGDCEQIWIAVNMISSNGFKFIQDHINIKAKQRVLGGVGLPTSPQVLRELMDKEGLGIFESKIQYKKDQFFHPKVYIIRSSAN